MGKLITFDGHDGCGKTELIKSISKKFCSEGLEVSILKTVSQNYENFRKEEKSASKNIWFYLSAWLDTEKKILKIENETNYIFVDRSYYSTYVLAYALNLTFPNFIFETYRKPDLAVQVQISEETRYQRLNAKKDFSEHDKKTKNKELIKKANQAYESLNLFKINNENSIEETTITLYNKLKQI